MVTRVLLRVPSTLHSTLGIIANNPPDGYLYMREEHKLWEQSNAVYRTMSRLLRNHLQSRNALLLVREKVESSLKPLDSDLVFSLGPYTGFSPKPTILYSNEFAGGEGTVLARALLLVPNIKKVLVPNRTSAQAYLGILSQREFSKLIGILRVGVTIPAPFRKERRERVTLLFVSSANVGDAKWGDASFYLRGGLDVLASFRLLNSRYGDRVNLVVCSDIPERVRREFADVFTLRNVDTPGIVPRKVLDSIYSKSDILLYPGYRGVSTITEAFGYYLPVVASDSWDLGDYVTDGYNGLQVHRKNKGKTQGFTPSWYPDSIASEPIDEGFVTRFAEAVSLLIEDESLRTRLGRGARETVDSGPFSIRFMKEELAKFFHEALAS